jgi:predicted ester cyclase
MSERNKQVYQRFMDEVVNGKNLSVLDELIADDFVDHNPVPGTPSTKAGMREQMEMFFTAFPDMAASTTFLLSDGEYVIGHHRTRGTNQGDFMGMPATGKRIEVDEIHIVRFADGKAVEHWGLVEEGAMMTQLGLIEAPAG